VSLENGITKASLPALLCIEWLDSWREIWGIMLEPVHTSSAELVSMNKEQMK
jgi:hypothetical protein